MAIKLSVRKLAALVDDGVMADALYPRLLVIKMIAVWSNSGSISQEDCLRVLDHATPQSAQECRWLHYIRKCVTTDARHYRV